MRIEHILFRQSVWTWQTIGASLALGLEMPAPTLTAVNLAMIDTAAAEAGLGLVTRAFAPGGAADFRWRLGGTDILAAAFRIAPGDDVFRLSPARLRALEAQAEALSRRERRRVAPVCVFYGCYPRERGARPGEAGCTVASAARVLPLLAQGGGAALPPDRLGRVARPWYGLFGAAPSEVRLRPVA